MFNSKEVFVSEITKSNERLTMLLGESTSHIGLIKASIADLKESNTNINKEIEDVSIKIANLVMVKESLKELSAANDELIFQLEEVFKERK